MGTETEEEESRGRRVWSRGMRGVKVNVNVTKNETPPAIREISVLSSLDPALSGRQRRISLTNEISFGGLPHVEYDAAPLAGSPNKNTACSWDRSTVSP